MFYNQVSILCKRNKISISKMATTIGLSKSNVTRWKEGVVPKSDTVQKIADYFNVTTDYLLTGSDTPAPPPADKPLFTAEDIELLLKIKNLPPTERKEVESFVQFKEAKKETVATIAT